MSLTHHLANPLSVLSPTGIRFLAGTLALCAWLTITLQWSLMFGRSAYSFKQTLSRFLGYFTILSNILVALAFTAWFIYPVSILMDKPVAIISTAISVYIIIVGVIYHLLLRKSFPLVGLDKLANALLHTWLPLFYVLFWYLLVPAGMLDISLIAYFLILPLLYLGYILILGHLTTHYPYPFVNVAENGYPKVIRNAVLIALSFVLLSALLIYIKS
jgi:hypothetical protein